MSTLVGGLAPQAPIPRAAEVKAYFYANAVVGETRRFRQIDRYEAHYLMRQYAHQEIDWWGFSADQMETVSPEVQVPVGFTQPAMALNVRMRRPTAPANLCKAIVDRFTGLLFSEARRPDVSWEGDPATEDFMQAVMEQARFWAKWREARAIGGSCGSVLLTAHLRNGKFSIETHNPKHCQIVWKDRRTFTPLAVLKLYRYPVEEDIIDERTGELKGTRVVEYLYRRVITEQDDTVYVPVKIEPGASLAWEIESEVQHGLGFFPGAWVQNLPRSEQEDGDPDAHGAWQSFDLMDRILSQMNKAALLNLDPTLALSVDPRVVEMLGGSVRKGSDNALMLGTGGSASYLEITGSGIEAGQKIYKLVEDNALKVTRCVLVDPQTISGAAQSAKAIEYIYAPMLEKADDLRAQYGDTGVVPMLLVLEKIARTFYGKSVQVEPDKIGKYAFNLPPKLGEDGKMAERVLGPGGYVRLKWGPYFAPTETDKQTAINNAVAAKAGGVLDQETAIKTVASLYDVRDPHAMMAKINEEQTAEMEKMLGAGGVPPEAAEPETATPAGEGGKP